ncbi:MAG: ABC transporter permease [Clostridium sp.]|uniref:ABC transporter permease n=1 Tax=Clostridium sp. TaxID=1506 RepID=UPI002A8A890A|nr:ABC transporter permease [Clostridium sp.]MDY5097699.1 ABC transporter permease [Clostridium sp.]
MLWYSVKRFFSMIVTLFLITTLTFFLMHAVPGDPFELDRETPQAVKENLEKKYGLDKPLGEQYVIYLKNLVKGDLGESMIYKGQTVNDKIQGGIVPSATIGVVGIAFGVVIGLVLGIVAALYRGRGLDYVVILAAIIGVSIPSFVFGSLIQYVFGVNLRVLPVAGWGTLACAIAPVTAATMGNIAFFARMTRTSMLDQLGQDYVTTATSKGLSRGEVVRKHVLRNSLLPLVTSVGPMTAGAFMGSFVIEKIFDIPGLGQHLVLAIQNNDYMMIMGLTVFFAALSVFFLFLGDLLYGVVDPRIRIDA